MSPQPFEVQQSVGNLVNAVFDNVTPSDLKWLLGRKNENNKTISTGTVIFGILGHWALIAFFQFLECFESEIVLVIPFFEKVLGLGWAIGLPQIKKV